MTTSIPPKAPEVKLSPKDFSDRASNAPFSSEKPVHTPGSTYFIPNRTLLHVYADAQGKPVLGKYRMYTEKGKIPATISSSGKGSGKPAKLAKAMPHLDYAKNKHLTQELFYKHNEVLRHDKRKPLCVDEGETGADFLNLNAGRYGIPASLFATSTWSSSIYTEAHATEAGRHKAIIHTIDHDAQGIRFGIKRAEANPGSTLLLSPTPGNDIKDHFEQGGTWNTLKKVSLDELRALLIPLELSAAIAKLKEQVLAKTTWQHNVTLDTAIVFHAEGKCGICNKDDDNRRLHLTIRENENKPGQAIVLINCQAAEHHHEALLDSVGLNKFDILLNAAVKKTGTLILSHPDCPFPVAQELGRAWQHNGASTLTRWRGDYYRWVATHWKRLSEDNFEDELWTTLGKAMYEKEDDEGKKSLNAWNPNISRVKNVARAAAALSSRDDSTEPGNKELVALQNGLFNTSTYEMMEHTPKVFNTFALDFSFDVDATAPIWEKTLLQWFGEDQQSIDTLQEWFGYLLSNETIAQKLLQLIGPKRSGKGTISHIIQALLGKQAVCTPTIADLGDPFNRYGVVGKSLMLIADNRNAESSARGGKKRSLEFIIGVSGEDDQTIPVKHRAQPWIGKIDARIMICGNVALDLPDAAGTTAERSIVIKMTKEFSSNDKRDPHLRSKLEKELPGIFNWAMEGLERLVENEFKFTQPESGEAIRQEMETSSPEQMFASQHCTTGPDEEADFDAFWASWTSFCDTYRFVPGNAASLVKRFRAISMEIEGQRARRNGARIKILKGISLNANTENGKLILPNNKETN